MRTSWDISRMPTLYKASCHFVQPLIEQQGWSIHCR